MEMSKAQLMSLTLLVMFVLMLSILLVFAVITINYNNVAQSVALSTTSTNYAALLQPGIAALARASLGRALTVLAQYELQPNLRGSNFITNLNASLSTMMANGMLPGAPLPSAGGAFIANGMGNLTLSRYNQLLTNAINSSYRVITINQTAPNITQYSPYNLSATFIDKVTISSASGVYKYDIPINVSVPLTGTLDLFYAQRGILQYINFSQSSKAVPFISGQGHGMLANASYAVNGNSVAYGYGTVYSVPAQVTCSGYANPLTNYIPAALTTPPLSNTIIIVTPDASLITNSVCSIANNYGGLITYKITNAPTGPWLVYANTANQLSTFQTGDQVLVYGPTLAALNVSPLQSAFYNGYYFASPFAPSYASRVVGALASASPQGSFNLLGSNLQTGYFNGATSQIILPALTGIRSVSLWLKTGSSAQQPVYDSGACSSGGSFQIALTASGGVGGSPGSNNPGVYLSFNGDDIYVANTNLANNNWQNVVVSWNGGTQVYVGVNGLLPSGYVWNGATWSSLETPPFTLPSAPSPVANPAMIGSGRCLLWNTGSLYFNGLISDVQIYNVPLVTNQTLAEYQGGVYGLPTAARYQLAWLPLNGNANDYSGKGNNGIATSVTYGLIQNYSFDSVFDTPAALSNSLAVPGLLSCSNNLQCLGPTIPHASLGNLPLGTGGLASAAQFNGQSSYVNLPQISQEAGTNPISFTVWFNVLSLPGSWPMVFGDTAGSPRNGYDVYVSSTWKDAYLERYSAGTDNAIYSNPISLNTWYFLAGTYNGITLSLYMNGNLISYGSTSGTITPDSLMSLGADSGYYNFGNYQLSDLQVYNTALSTNQVAALSTEGIDGVPVAPTNIIGWWPLLGNTNDYSGGGNTGSAISVSYTPLGQNGITIVPWQTGTGTIQTERQFFGFT